MFNGGSRHIRARLRVVLPRPRPAWPPGKAAAASHGHVLERAPRRRHVVVTGAGLVGEAGRRGEERSFGPVAEAAQPDGATVKRELTASRTGRQLDGPGVLPLRAGTSGGPELFRAPIRAPSLLPITTTTIVAFQDQKRGLAHARHGASRYESAAIALHPRRRCQRPKTDATPTTQCVFRSAPAGWSWFAALAATRGSRRASAARRLHLSDRGGARAAGSQLIRQYAFPKGR